MFMFMHLQFHHTLGPNANKDQSSGRQQQQRTMGTRGGNRGARNQFNNGLGNSVRGGRKQN